jgi:hypothetical protein
LNKADNAMAIINPANGKVVATIPMGRSPHEAAVEPRPDEFHWAPFLKELSEFRLSYPRVAAAVPEGKAQESWLGEPPASEQQIEALQDRLNRALPPSYRSFLATSNGFNGRRTSSPIGFQAPVDTGAFASLWRKS